MTPNFHFAPLDSLLEKCQGTEFKPSDFMPTLQNPSDTGYDVRAAEDVIINPGAYFKISVGLKVLAPPGWWLESRPRSSTFFKKCCVTHTGTIDNGYPEAIRAAGIYLPDSNCSHKPLKISFGERIFQFLPMRLQHMNIIQLSEAEIDQMHKESKSSRTGGIGSTGDR